MEYINVKNIEKYHPGYKDRDLAWCKLYFSVLHGDYEFAMIENETDKWRFIVFIISQLIEKKPIPCDEKYLRTKWCNFKKRRLSSTIIALENFIEILKEIPADYKNPVTEDEESLLHSVTEDSKCCNVERENISNINKKNINRSSRDKDFSLQNLSSFVDSNQTHTDTDKIINYWCTEFYKNKAFYYPLNPEKDPPIMKKLLENQSKNILMKCIQEFFKISKTDKWLKNKATIAVFAHKLPDLLVKIGDDHGYTK